MRILFDAFWWSEGPISNRAVQRELIRAWKVAFPEDELALLVRASANVDDVWSDAEVIRARLPLQLLINRLELPTFANRWNADLVLAHNFAAPVPRSGVFIHDFMFLDHPEWFTRKENFYFRNMKFVPRHAAVFTSSEAEARRISRHLRARTVEATGLSIDPDLSDAEPLAVEGLAKRGFLLTVGRLNIRKNIELTIEAALMSGMVNPGNPLVVVGEESGRTAHLGTRAQAALDSGAVRLLGTIRPGELRWLYAHCSLFLCLSLDEGFGLPSLEASTFGASSILSDLEVFREIARDSATYVDPRSVREAADAIRSAMAAARRPSPDLSRYSWRRAAQRIRDGLAKAE